jgi:hypothetical protein
MQREIPMVLAAFRQSKSHTPPDTASARDPRRRTARTSAPLGLAYELARRSVLSFSVKSSLWILCLEGQLWLTTPDGRDHVLGAGESLTFHGTGKVVVEALHASNLWVRAESDPPS